MAYPLIYFFTSPYCAPCKTIEKMLDEVNISLFGNKLRIKKVDIAKELDIARKFKILSVPTIIISVIRRGSIYIKRYKKIKYNKII
ncbi:MAG: thioredoxin family protein [Promethearchaeota archaeon]